MALPEAQYYANYRPSLAAAIILTVLFTCTTALHLFQLIRHRTWYFIPFMVGGIFEIIGYLGRSIGAHEYPDCTMVPYILNTLLPLVAPALFAASIYMVLGRIIRKTGGKELSLIRVSWLTKIFVLGDVLSFLVQVIGGIVLANAKSKSSVDRGELLITIGLVIQLVFFGLFTISSILYDYRLRANPTESSLIIPWRPRIIMLYVSSGLILIRSVFRLIEYLQGQDGELLSKEVYLYVFDAAMMLLVVICFNWKYPSIFTSDGRNRNTEDVETSDGYGVLLQSAANK